MFDPRETISITDDGRRLFEKAHKDNVETVWDRHEAQQPQCGFCDMGLSCRVCNMGPCRVDPFGEGPQAGVCGADADIIVARNLCRMIAAGAASHSDHGRDLVEVLESVASGTAPGYKIRDEAKLKRRGRRVWRGRRRPGRPGHCRRSGPGHDGRLRHAAEEDHACQPGAGQTAGRVGKGRDHAAGDRSRNLGDDAPDPHGGRQQLGNPPGPGPAQCACPMAGAGP